LGLLQVARKKKMKTAQGKSAISPELRELELEVLQAVDSRKIVELTSSLVKIPSLNPPGEEKNLAEFIASWFEKRHFDFVLTEAVANRPNVEVRLEGEGECAVKEMKRKKTLVFNGHMDVVPPGCDWVHDPFGGEIENGKVYGRGSADMKGGLAAMMILLEVLRSKAKNKLRGSVIFDAVVGEEISCPYGTYHMVKRGLRGDFAIVGEPTDMTICSAHKGNITYEITTHGKAAHASVPHTGINAIMKMHKIIGSLEKYGEEIKEKYNHPLLSSPTVNIGVINGGVKSNIVPDRCWVSAERRIVPPQTVESAKSEIIQLLANLAKQDEELVYSIEFTQEMGASEIKGGEDGVRAILSAYDRVTDSEKPSALVGFVASCDAYFLNSVAQIPTVVFGPGRMKNIHTHDEYVDVQDLETCTKIYALTALNSLV